MNPVDPWIMRWTVVVLAACGDAPATPDGASEPVWAHAVIRAGEHTARVLDGAWHDPIVGVTSVTGRDYEIALDATAIYDLGTDDQYDWNKLPGLSDCGEIDLSREGAMFGWRWSTSASAIEVAAYANNAGAHLTSDVLFTVAAADIPIRYTVAREAARYVFSASGPGIAVTAELPRRCAGEPLEQLAWAGEFYFGGTSAAPHDVTARIREY